MKTLYLNSDECLAINALVYDDFLSNQDLLEQAIRDNDVDFQKLINDEQAIYSKIMDDLGC